MTSRKAQDSTTLTTHACAVLTGTGIPVERVLIVAQGGDAASDPVVVALRDGWTRSAEPPPVPAPPPGKPEVGDSR